MTISVSAAYPLERQRTLSNTLARNPRNPHWVSFRKYLKNRFMIIVSILFPMKGARRMFLPIVLAPKMMSILLCFLNARRNRSMSVGLCCMSPSMKIRTSALSLIARSAPVSMLLPLPRLIFCWRRVVFG